MGCGWSPTTFCLPAGNAPGRVKTRAERTLFRLLDCIGEAVGASPLEEANTFLERVAADRTEGGWVVIASAMGGQLDRDPAGDLARC